MGSSNFITIMWFTTITYLVSINQFAFNCEVKASIVSFPVDPYDPHHFNISRQFAFVVFFVVFLSSCIDYDKLGQNDPDIMDAIDMSGLLR